MSDENRHTAGQYGDVRTTSSRYNNMSDAALRDFALDFNELTEQAQALLREEFLSRSLPMPTPKPEVSPKGPPDPEPGYVPELDEVDEEPLTGFTGDPQDLVTVRSFRDLPEAFVARAILEEADIPCFLQDEHMVGMIWSYSNFIGGVRLQVPRENVVQADEILSQPIPASFATDSGADFEQPVCPQCGSLDVSQSDSDRKVLAASMLIGLPLPFRKPSRDKWKCHHCGCRWIDDADPE
jgi:hypothetical protein